MKKFKVTVYHEHSDGRPLPINCIVTAGNWLQAAIKAKKDHPAIVREFKEITKIEEA